MLCAKTNLTQPLREATGRSLPALAVTVLLALWSVLPSLPLTAQTTPDTPAATPPAAVVPAPAVDNSLCASCHEDVAPVGAHGRSACASCHKQHEEYPHPADVALPACADCHKKNGHDFDIGVHGAAGRAGQPAPDCSTCHGVAHEVQTPSSFDFRKKLPEICSGCHDDVAKHFGASVHGTQLAAGVADAPNCATCHGEHAIRKPSDPASTVNARNIRETCGQCHGNVRLARRHNLPTNRLSSFDDSFHGLALKGGSQTVANCASCHGVHDILPSSDRRSMTHESNLPKTCGQCHEGAGSRFAIGVVHLAEGEEEPVGVTWVRLFYLIIIPLTLGLMLVHNGGDWIRKLIKLRKGQPRVIVAKAARSHRMFPLERLQHAGLAISFIVLTWSGFALVWPDRWWAMPLTGFEGAEVRRNIHRVAAVVFIIVSLSHVLTLILSPRLRSHWKEMIPKWRDVGDAIGQFSYNIGLRKSAPALPSHSYIEKAEYWAVVWGGVLMSITGLLLWANNLAMAYLPKSWLDVATAVHWYEAILAAAAIVIWHFYGVIFDPDVYPLDTAFLTGYSVREHGAHDDAIAAAGDNGPAQSPQTDGQHDRVIAGA